MNGDTNSPPLHLPDRQRDTNTWYLNRDPLSVVDDSLVKFVLQYGGQELLDLGCGSGGYSKVFESHGRKVLALDVNSRYVEIAQQLGVNAALYDGQTIPLPDKSVDTIVMIEVIEHIADPGALVAELKRVARNNVILTTPNCSYSFKAPLVLNHMLDIDHKHFFTATSLRALLSQDFSSVHVAEALPVDEGMAKDILPRPLFKLWRVFRKIGVIQDRYYYRLIANAII